VPEGQSVNLLGKTSCLLGSQVEHGLVQYRLRDFEELKCAAAERIILHVFGAITGSYIYLKRAFGVLLSEHRKPGASAVRMVEVGDRTSSVRGIKVVLLLQSWEQPEEACYFDPLLVLAAKLGW